MSGFGSFTVLCTEVPSYPWCNLFFKQLLSTSPATLSDVNLAVAPVGIHPTCGIPRLGNGRLGNVANIIACGLSMLAVVGLIAAISRRKAAVGRVEIRALFVLYFISLPLQLLTIGSIFDQGSLTLVVLTAIHAGVVTTLFWMLLANAIIATQVVEDGTAAALLPFFGFSIIIFAIATYISMDTALGVTSIFKSNPPTALQGIAIFVLTSIWPAFTAIVYFAIMAYVVVVVLREVKPLWYYGLSMILFVLSQLDYFLLSKILCTASGAAIDGSFIATLLETGSMGALYFAWRSITEDTWDDPWYPTDN